MRNPSSTLPGSLQGKNVLSSINLWDYDLTSFLTVNEFCSDPNLHFVESPALAPPEVQIDLAEQQR